VVIVEDHILFAEAVSLALRLAGFPVERLALSDHVDTVTAVLRLRPSVVLVDLDLGPYGNGIDLIEPLTRAGTAVVVVTGSADRSQWGGCLHRGARAVLSKNGPLVDMVEAIRRLAHGVPATPKAERDALLRTWRRDGRDLETLHERFSRLTPRERQVLGELATGHSIRDIAAADVVSEATVRTQVKSILAKLEVTSQLGAVVLANRLGWHASGHHVPPRWAG
jgi:two-component system, NarL family, nitrate/nitrite response regulator NarL